MTQHSLEQSYTDEGEDSFEAVLSTATVMLWLEIRLAAPLYSSTL